MIPHYLLRGFIPIPPVQQGNLFASAVCLHADALHHRVSMNNIRIGIRLGAAFGFMALLVMFMVLIGIIKINSLGQANDEISGSLYVKASTSLSLRYYTSDMSRLARNAILLSDATKREKAIRVKVFLIFGGKNEGRSFSEQGGCFITGVQCRIFLLPECSVRFSCRKLNRWLIRSRTAQGLSSFSKHVPA